jgi:hypothetical protein
MDVREAVALASSLVTNPLSLSTKQGVNGAS